ncbi:MAG: leucine-rich repeat protein, partial [Clostridia bacterium]
MKKRSKVLLIVLTCLMIVTAVAVPLTAYFVKQQEINNLQKDPNLSPADSLLASKFAFRYKKDNSGNPYYEISAYKGIDTNVIVPDTFRGSPVKSLSRNAFNGLSNSTNSKITSISLPSSLNNIAGSVFASCSSLKTINFKGKTNTFDSSIKIGSFAFSSCYSLNSLTVTTDTKLGEGAFTNCLNLKTLNIVLEDGSANKTLDKTFVSSLQNSSVMTLSIDRNIKIITDSAFAGFSGLKSVSIPASCSVALNAFNSSNKIEKLDITIGNTISAEIDDTNVAGLINPACLKTVTLADRIVGVQALLFNNCSKLETINLDKVKSIGDNAFRGCASLRSVSLSSINVIGIGSGAFENCSLLQTVELSKIIETIKPNTFKNCVSLENIVMPESLKNIEEYAFFGSRISTLEFGDNLININEHAFGNNTMLRNISIDSKVLIGNTSFENVTFKNVVIRVITTPLTNDYVSKIVTGSLTALTISDKPYVANLFQNGSNGSFASGVSVGKKSIQNLYFNIDTNIDELSRNMFEGIEIEHIVLTGSTTNIITQSVAKLFLKTSVKSIQFDDKIKKIAPAAFEGFTSLKSVGFLSPELDIGNQSFKDCTLLNDVVFNSSSIINVKLMSNSFENTLFEKDIGVNGFTIIAGNLIKYTGKDVDVVIPETVNNIATDAFSQNTNIISVSVSSGTVINVGAFASNPINKVTITRGTNFNVNYNLAQIFPQLKTLEIFNGIQFAEAGNVLLNNSTPVTLDSLKINGFDNAELSASMINKLGNNFIKMELAGSISRIPEKTFFGFSKLINVIINASVISIGDSSFEDTSINALVLPETLQAIEVKAFKNTRLTSVTFPNSLLTIKNSAFSTNTELAKIEGGQNVTLIEDDVFTGTAWINQQNGYIIFGGSLIAYKGTDTKIEIDGKVTALSNGVNVERTYNRISTGAFANLPLESVTIKNLNIVFGNDIFAGTGVTEVTIDATEINRDISNLFNGDSPFTSVVFKNSANSKMIFTGTIINGATRLKNITMSANSFIESANSFINSSLLTNINFSGIGLIPNANFMSLANNKSNNKSTIKTLVLDNEATVEPYSMQIIQGLQNVVMGFNAVVKNVFGNDTVSVLKILGTKEINTDFVNNLNKTALKTLNFADFGEAENKIIANNSFESFSNVTLKLPNNLTAIGDNAFMNSKIKTLTLPASVKSIGSNAFRNMKALDKINFAPEMVIDNFGENVFLDSKWIDSLRLETPNQTEIQNKFGTGLIIANGDVTVASTIYLAKLSTADVNLSSSPVKFITENAFGGSKLGSKFTTATLSEKIVLLGSGAFAGCSSLTTINAFPSLITSIKADVFKNCSSLTDINNMATLNEIGKDSFNGCMKLATINIATDGKFDNTAFLNTNVINLNIFSSSSSLAVADTFMNSFLPLINSVTKIVFHGITNINNSDTGIFADMKSLSTIDLQFSPNIVVGNNSFKNIKTLNNILSTTSIKSIGDSSFSGCSNLNTKIDFSSCVSIGNRAFENCTALTAVTIATAIGTMGEYAFSGTGLTSLDLSTLIAMTIISNYAFSNCVSLTSVTLPENTFQISTGSFEGCSTLAQINLKNVNFIKDNAFKNCKLLNNIVTTSLNEIGISAFENCTSLLSTAGNGFILDNVTKLSARAFFGCSELTNIDLSSVTGTIGNSAFENCIKLRLLTINPETVVGSNAFVHTIIDSINFVNNMTGTTKHITSSFMTSLRSGGIQAVNVISLVFSGAFEIDNNTTGSAGAFEGFNKLVNVDLSSINVIGNNAFNACASLTTVTLSSALTRIGSNAFKGSALNNLMLTNNVAVGKGAFANVTALSAVTLPLSVNFESGEGVSAFDNTSITHVEFKGSTTSSMLTKNYVNLLQNNGLNKVAHVSFNGAFTTESVNMDIVTDTTTIGVFSAWTNLIDINLLGVTTLGNATFMNSNNLTNVDFGTIPTVTSIGDNCFAGLKSFNNIVIPESVVSLGKSAFADSGITNITLSSQIKTIKNSTFKGCVNLASINISNIANIEANAFHSSGLTTIALPTPITELNESTFNNCKKLTAVTFPNNFVAIGNSAFEGCSELSINFANLPNLTTIGNNSFRNALKQNSLDFTSNLLLTNIGANAFAGANAVQTITINNNVAVSENSFAVTSLAVALNIKKLATGNGNCSANYSLAFGAQSVLNEITIGEGITTLTSNFGGLQKLATVNVPTTLTTIGNDAFVGDILLSKITTAGDVSGNLNGVINISLITSIGNNAFANCSAIASVNLSNINPVLIGNNAFSMSGNTALATINLNKVTTIGDSAFAGCVKLNNVDLSSATNIGNLAFSGATLLSEVILRHSVVFGNLNNAFTGTKITKLNLLIVGNRDTIITKEIMTNMINQGITANLVKEIGIVGEFSVNAGTNSATGVFTAFNNITSFNANGVLQIGAYAFTNCSLLTNVIITNCTSIGNYAFKSTNLTSGNTDASALDLSNVVTIGDSAFYGLTTIANVKLGTELVTIDNNAFTGCTGLSVNLSSCVKLQSIGDSAFSGNAYKNVTLDLTQNVALTNIGVGAFLDCVSITSLKILNKNASYIGVNAFSGTNVASLAINAGDTTISSNYDLALGTTKTKITSLTFGDGINAINGKFSNLTSLSSVVLPTNNVTIGESAFMSNTSLANINLSKATSIGAMAFKNTILNSASLDKLDLSLATSIGNMAFSNANLKNGVTFGAGLANIGDSAFSENKFTSIDFTGVATTLTNVANNMFKDCTLLTSVTLSSSMTQIGDFAFAGTALNLIKKTQDNVLTGITQIGTSAFENTKLPAISLLNVSSLGTSAFKGCALLASVVFNNELRTLSDNAFFGCSTLNSVNLPSKAEIIGEGAFAGTSLGSISLPQSVTTINGNAFANISALKNVMVYNCTKIISINANAFSGTTNVTGLEIVKGDNSILNSNYSVISKNIVNLSTGSGILTIASGVDFNDFGRLKNVYMDVKIVGTGLFNACPMLAELYVNRGVVISVDAFYKDKTSYPKINLSGYQVSSGADVLFTGSVITSNFTSKFDKTTIKTMGFVGGSQSVKIADDAFLGFGYTNKVYLNGCSFDSGFTSAPDVIASIGNNAFKYRDSLYLVVDSMYQPIMGTNVFEGYNGMIAGVCTLEFTKDKNSNDKLTTHESFRSNISGIRDIIIPDSITAIGNGSFEGFSAISTFDLKNVTNIGARAFFGCASIDNINFSKVVTIGDSAFENTNLTANSTFTSLTTLGAGAFAGTKFANIDISGVSIINDRTFDGCINLITVTNNALFTQIGNSAFNGCTKLANINLTNVTQIGNSAFSGCSALPSILNLSRVNQIGNNAFANCSTIKTLTINNNATISSNSFSGVSVTSLTIIKSGTSTIVNKDYTGLNLTSVESITFGDGITSIQSSFGGLNALKTIILPTSVTIIGDTARSSGQGVFDTCSALNSINLSNVEAIGYASFSGCTSLVNIDLSRVTTIGSRAFSSCRMTTLTLPNIVSIMAEAFINCNSITSITMGSGLQTFDSSALNVSSLNSITMNNNNKYKVEGNCLIEIAVNEVVLGCKSSVIPSGITSIGDNAFFNATGLTNIVIPSSVTRIGINAFKACSSLTNIVIPDAVTQIDDSAFAGTSALIKVLFNSTSPCNIGTNLFSINAGFTIQVPSIYKLAYTTNNTIVNWEPYKPYIADLYITQGQFKFDPYTNTIFEYTGTTDTIVDIPETIDGVYVLYLKESLFENKTTIQKVTIPTSIKELPSSVFAGCTGLTMVNSNVAGEAKVNTLSLIKTLAFKNCTGLKTAITAVDAVVQTDAWLGSGITTVTIEGEAGTVVFSFDIPNKTIRSYQGTDRRVIIPTSIGGVPVKVIGDNAFLGAYMKYKCVSVVIPNGVTTIKNSAFADCTELTSITIPSSVTTIEMNAFANCTKLASVNFETGSKLTTIGDSAFGGCTALTSITIPSSVTTIGQNPFVACSNLSSINMVANSNYKAESDCLIDITTNTLILGCKNSVIPSGVTTIGMGAFYQCTGLTSITIPNTVTTIGYLAFRGCTGLTSITIPSSVTTMGDSVFSGCTGLINVIMEQPNSSALTVNSTIFPSSNVGFKIYVNPANEEEYKTNNAKGWSQYAGSIASTLTTADGYAFVPATGTITGYTGSATVLDIPSIIVGVSVKTIADNAFKDKTTITSITIPSSVTTIGMNSFRGCTGLTSITLPNSVTTIGSDAFNGCTALTSVNFETGSKLTTIGDSAF